VRIFTPSREMPFAGHPTVGTSFVLLDEVLVGKKRRSFLLEEKIGAIPIRVDPGKRPLIWLRTPTIQDGKIFDRALCAELLGLHSNDLLEIPPQYLSAGNPTIFVALKDKTAVDQAWLDLSGLQRLKNFDPEPCCLFAFAPIPQGAYSRMFAPEYGVPEDPATGSSTGPLAAFMMRHGLVPSASGTRFVSEQGTKMGRRSFVHAQIHGEMGSNGIDVGGYVTPLVEATMHL
jgi:trans-2,3-dihydro-3-hydroxyanthranilate isomerase